MMRMRRVSVSVSVSVSVLFLLVVLVLAGCDSAPTDPQKGNGELHEGEFLYSCTSPADAFCASHVPGPPSGSLPAGIALGADFVMRFDQPATTLDADAVFFDLGGDGTVHAKRAGYGAILARAANGDVIDFVNMRVHDVAGLGILGVDSSTVLAAGETRAVRGEPLDATTQVLAGTLAYGWETSNAAVVSVSVSDDDRIHGGATLRAVAPGVATIRVVSGASTGTVSFQVGGT
jgi:hypothetical protein